MKIYQKDQFNYEIQLTFLQKNHNKTKRNFIQRMKNNKIHCMKIAKKYEKDYWDGDRKYGW